MSLLITALLLVVAYFLYESGLSILALVVILVAILQALSKPSYSSAGAAVASGQRPVIVTTSGGKIPETLKIVTKKTWPGTSFYEDFWTYLGGVIEWPIRIAIRLFTGRGGVAKGGKSLDGKKLEKPF
ncbi:hypothetical protein HZC09_01605 [Candidatus Micrarchaeota archaeon]|nr:hypothetical protein [Candidatus Micrarchaeota archaeon]